MKTGQNQAPIAVRRTWARHWEEGVPHQCWKEGSRDVMASHQSSWIRIIPPRNRYGRPIYYNCCCCGNQCIAPVFAALFDNPSFYPGSASPNPPASTMSHVLEYSSLSLLMSFNHCLRDPWYVHVIYLMFVQVIPSSLFPSLLTFIDDNLIPFVLTMQAIPVAACFPLKSSLYLIKLNPSPSLTLLEPNPLVRVAESTVKSDRCHSQNEGCSQ